MNSPDNYSYIYGAARTPVGKYKGAFLSVPATHLGAIAIREAIQRSLVPVDRITDVVFGNVLSAGLGQAPARQAAIHGGLPTRVGALTINKVCGSGLKAVMLADNLVRLGESGFVVAGGMENMSRAPKLECVAGSEGEGDLRDSMVYDGLWDSFGDCHMGQIAEALAKRENYSREDQDRYALESYRRAREAQAQCRFAKEIVPVRVTAGDKELLVEKDEQPFAHALEKLPELGPAFVRPDGTVTAGNSSSINDGAAAAVVGPYDPSIKPLARIIAHASNSMDPDQFPVAPVGAIQKLLDRWGVEKNDIDLFEINEAFAVTTLAVCDRLGLDYSRVNVNGGAVALGHPIGASGARILVTLLYALKSRNLKKGVAAICIGGGEAVALGVEMINN